MLGAGPIVGSGTSSRRERCMPCLYCLLVTPPVLYLHSSSCAPPRLSISSDG